MRVAVTVLEPHFVAHDKDRVCTGLAVAGMDSSSEDGVNAEELEGVGGNADTLEALGSLASGIEDIEIVDADHLREGVGLTLQFQELRGGVCAAATVLAALQVMDLHGENSLGIAVREGLEEHIFDYAEDGRRGTDSEAKRHDSHGHETRLFPEAAQAITDVLADARHDRFRRDGEVQSSSRKDKDEAGTPRVPCIPLAPVDHLWDTCSKMPSRKGHPLEGEMLQGTLDLLILQTLVLGPAHGHSIAHVIEQRSEEVLQVEHGSLYPALHRLENRGWIASFWGTSDNNRKARYYRLTAAGRKQLLEHTSRWDRLVRAVNRVLRPAEE